MVDRALSFGAAAATYDQTRPTYPEAALRWALGDRPLRVIDLGAGTGILSRVLLRLGHEVVPVEPDEAMRAQFRKATPGVTPLAGRAEEIPLPDASVDAVVAGQAYHWFDKERTHAELARVIRPGGRFAPVWNVRDASAPWVAALSAIADDALGGHGIREADRSPSSFGEGFSRPERATFDHRVRHTPESLLAMVTTRSSYLTAPPAVRATIEQRVRQLCATHPDLAGRDSFDMPYQTVVLRATRV